jgi:hypothetical protein
MMRYQPARHRGPILVSGQHFDQFEERRAAERKHRLGCQWHDSPHERSKQDLTPLLHRRATERTPSQVCADRSTIR